MKKILFPLLLPPLLANAYTSEEFHQRKNTLTKLSQVFMDAEARLPPCLGHDRAAEESLQHEPPSSCPLAKKFFAHIESADAKLRANCYEMSRWLETQLQDPSFCSPGLAGEERMERAKREIMRLRQEINHAFGFEADQADEAENWGKDEDEAEQGLESETGEFARMECALPMTIGLQFRKKQLTLANRHYAVAESSLSDACQQGQAGLLGKEEYAKAVRGDWQ